MNQNFGNITRGGQTFLHSLRMMTQILRMVMVSSFILFCSVYLIWFMTHTTSYTRYLTGVWLMAKPIYHMNPHSTHKLKEPDGQVVKVYNAAILSSSKVQTVVNEVKVTARQAGWISISTVIPFSLLTLWWFSQRGKATQATELKKGTYVTTPHIMNRMLRKTGKMGDLTLGEVGLHDKAELQHFLIHGTTGTGKSYLIRTLLYQIRRRNNKAIVYDKHGTLVAKFFNPETDVLLNPMDARCAPWDIWAECNDEADFDSIATALMPMPPSQDPFWVQAARTIFASLAIKMRTSSARSTKQFLSYLFSANLNDLETLLKGTEAEILVSEKSEKTALSVKSVLATYIKPLKYLKDASRPFSIRNWIQDESQTGWLFISSRADKHESLKPLISAWLDVAANALMSLPENPDRRIWMVIDELASLQKLPYLPATFAESRKFGGCLVAGLQNYFQLQQIYGPDGAKAIIDLCNIRAFFRAPSNEVAKWVSREIGEAELLETREGLSYGANTVRDGVTLNHQTINRPAVTATEISALPDLQGYLFIPPVTAQSKTLTWPIVRMKLTWQDHPSLAPAYVELPASSVELPDEDVIVAEETSTNVLSETSNTPRVLSALGSSKKQQKKSVLVDEVFSLD